MTFSVVLYTVRYAYYDVLCVLYIVCYALFACVALFVIHCVLLC